MKTRASNPVIPDYTPKNQLKKEEVKLSFSPCCQCGSAIGDGYYGRHSNGGTCSKKCETIFDAKPRYPPIGANYAV